MPSNRAAWLNKKQAGRVEIKPAPYTTTPKHNEIVIKNAAVAINPIDWILRDQDTSLGFPWLKFPFIPGQDSAGEVVEVGSGVTRFTVGDRVLGFSVACDKEFNDAAKSSFQIYTVLLADAASHIPRTLSYESASVLPLGLSTAACGLFQKDQLALQHPTVSPKPTGKTLLVWGGSTSVGCNAIQLAVAAGYDVIATASPKNFELCKKLGASQVFDYNSSTIVKDLTRAFKDQTTAGAITIGAGGAEAAMDVLHASKGDKFIAMASYPVPQPPPKNFVIVKTIYCFLSFIVVNWIKSKTRGIGTKFIFGSSLVHNEVGKAVYVDFLGKALEQGTYVAAPEPVVIGHGLEQLQAAMDFQKQGMSAKKVVVTL